MPPMTYPEPIRHGHRGFWRDIAMQGEADQRGRLVAQWTVKTPAGGVPCFTASYDLFSQCAMDPLFTLEQVYYPR